MKLKNVVKEETNDFEWIDDTAASLKETIILFEPKLDRGEWRKVLEGLNQYNLKNRNNEKNQVKWQDGKIPRDYMPFEQDGIGAHWLHELVIDHFGRMSWGGDRRPTELTISPTELESINWPKETLELKKKKLESKRFDYSHKEKREYKYNREDFTVIDGREFFNIPYEGEIPQISENKEDDFSWIKDVSANLNPSEKWTIVNDIDPNSLEVSEEIQEYLFKQGYKWLTGRSNFLKTRILVVINTPRHSPRGRFHGFSYLGPARREAERAQDHLETTAGPIYNWSEIRPKENIKEEDDFKWVRDFKSDEQIAKELFNSLEWRKKPNSTEELVKNPWNTSITKWSLSNPEGSAIIVRTFNSIKFYEKLAQYLENVYGVYFNNRAVKIVERLEELIIQKLKGTLNESEEELEWIKDVKSSNHIAKEIFKDFKWFQKDGTKEGIFIKSPWKDEKLEVKPSTKKDKLRLFPLILNQGYTEYLKKKWGIYDLLTAKEIYTKLKILINLKSKSNLNENKDFDWIHNIRTNKGIAEKIFKGVTWGYDENGDEESVMVPWKTEELPIKERYIDDLNKGFTAYIHNEWGIDSHKDILEIYQNLLRMLWDKIENKAGYNLNESKDLDWIRDFKPRDKHTFRVGDIIEVDTYRGGKSSWVIEIIGIKEGDSEGGKIEYKVLENNTDLPSNDSVGKIVNISVDRAKELIDSGYWRNINSPFNEDLKESKDFDWIKDVKPTFGELWDQNFIHPGDILVLSGELEGYKGQKKMVDDFKIQVTKVEGRDGHNFLKTSKFIPMDIKYEDFLGIDVYRNEFTDTYFTKSDRDMVVLKHEKKEGNLTESDDFEWARQISPIPQGLKNLEHQEPGRYKIWLGDITKEQQLKILKYLIDKIKNNDEIIEGNKALGMIYRDILSDYRAVHSLYFEIDETKSGLKRIMTTGMFEYLRDESTPKEEYLKQSRDYFDGGKSQNPETELMWESEDLDWIRDIPTDKKVTEDNWHKGMKVRIDPKSPFYGQGEYKVGTIIHNSNNPHTHPCSQNKDDYENCEWVKVKWPNGYADIYRIGPYEWDLLMDIDSLNESKEWDWVKDTSPNPFMNNNFGVFIDRHPTEEEVQILLNLLVEANRVKPMDNIRFNRRKKIMGGRWKYLMIDKQDNFTFNIYDIDPYIWRGVIDEENIIKFSELFPQKEIKESDEWDWVRKIPSHNFYNNEYYIDLEGLTEKERCDVQQIILDYGFSWVESGPRLQRQFCKDSMRYGGTSAYITHLKMDGSAGFLYRTEKSFERYKRIDTRGLTYMKGSELLKKGLNESDEFDWMKEIPNKLPKDKDWWIINDVDTHSLEVSKDIQNFLFKQGFKWISGDEEVLDQEFLAISHRGGSYDTASGKFGYYLPMDDWERENTVKDIEDRKEEGVEVYYWSDLISPQINESSDMDWIEDVNPIPELEVGSCFVDTENVLKTKMTIKEIERGPDDEGYIQVEVEWKGQLHPHRISYRGFKEDLHRGRYKQCLESDEEEDNVITRILKHTSRMKED